MSTLLLTLNIIIGIIASPKIVFIDLVFSLDFLIVGRAQNWLLMSRLNAIKRTLFVETRIVELVYVLVLLLLNVVLATIN
jgi:hypothetical protein